MKKRLLCIALILGGIMVFFSLNSRDNTKQLSENKHRQEIMALYLYNSYHNINTVEFKNIQKNHSTGSWDSDAIVNEGIYVKFSLFESNSYVNVSELISRNAGRSLVKKQEQSTNTSIDSIEIIFVEK